MSENETSAAVEETTPEAEAVVEEQVEAPAVEEPVAEEAPVEEPVAEEAAPVVEAVRQAKVYLCERGHRTLILWGEPPATCNARPTRSGAPCGRPIYHMTELPEQVQKALNPLKASKKKAGKK